jgi:hypothetical protein
MLAKLLVERCEATIPNLETREALGPSLISDVLKELDLPRDMGATPEQFYPIRWIESFKLWLPDFLGEIEERLAGAIFLPVYESFPRYLGLDTDKAPPKGSYLRNLIDALAPEFDRPELDSEEVRLATRKFFAKEGDWAARWLVSIRGSEVLGQLSLR